MSGRPAAITTTTEADLDRREAALRSSASSTRGHTTADGKYRLWPESLAWRRGWRWAKCNVPDHSRGCYHGCAPDLPAAMAAVEQHREEYRDEG